MAKLNWNDVSEIVAGMVLEGNISPNAVRPDTLVPPYNDLMKLYKSKKQAPRPDDAIQTIGVAAYKTALAAAGAVEELPANWVNLLEDAATRHEAGAVLDRLAKRLLAGEEVDFAPAQAAMSRMNRGQILLTPLSKLSGDEDPFILSGYFPIDNFIGGLPESGLTVVAGVTGTGKTWFSLKLAKCFAAQHKKNVAIFSLEMTALQLAHRAKNLMKIPRALHNLIHVADAVMGVDEIAAVAARENDYGMIIVDFAEYLLTGDSGQTEQAMAHIYRTLAILAKNLGIPVVLLAQLNRTYGNGQTPTLNMLRYSGMAEILSSLVIFLHNPTQVFINDADSLPLEPGKAYIIIAKSRFGYKMGGPGAMQVDFNGGEWGDRVYQWFSKSEAGGSTGRQRAYAASE